MHATVVLAAGADHQLRDALWTSVHAAYSPLSALFYHMLDQMVEDANLQVLWSSLQIEQPLLERFDNGWPLMPNSSVLLIVCNCQVEI
jgi:hypothetical protein